MACSSQARATTPWALTATEGVWPFFSLTFCGALKDCARSSDTAHHHFTSHGRLFFPHDDDAPCRIDRHLRMIGKGALGDIELLLPGKGEPSVIRIGEKDGRNFIDAFGIPHHVETSLLIDSKRCRAVGAAWKYPLVMSDNDRVRKTSVLRLGTGSPPFPVYRRTSSAMPHTMSRQVLRPALSGSTRRYFRRL